MTKTWLILFSLWFSIPLAFGNGILVVPVADAPISGAPGEVVTIAVNVQNQTDQAQKLRSNLQLPSGWSSLSNDFPFTLAAGKSTLKLLSVHVPPGALAGLFSIKYEVESMDEPVVVGRVELDFTIREVRMLLLEPADVPEFVQAGEIVLATFVLQNLGNTALDLSILAENCALQVPPLLRLAPNESVLLPVREKTLATLRQSGRLFLKVYARQQDSQTVLAYASSFVRVVPHRAFEVQKEQQLPVSLRLSHLYRQWQDGATASGFQGELYASGSIDAEGQNQIEVHLRGPDRFGLSQLGQFDEYYARFENKNHYLFVGDKTYSLSPLTETARYARGVEASLKSDGYEYGGFYHQPRFFPSVQEVLAGYVRRHFDERNQLSFSTMRKVYAEDRNDAVLTSVHGEFQPLNNTQVEAELSTGHHTGEWGKAALLRLHSQPLPKLIVSSGVIYADKNYPGFFSNTTSFYGQADYRATSALQFSLLVNQDEKNASRDTLFAVSPYSQLAQGGVSYQFKNKLSLRAFLRRNELKDRMETVKFNYREAVVRLQAVKDWQQFQATLTGEIGNRENLLMLNEDRFSKIYRAFLNFNYRVGQRHSVQGFAQYFQFNQAGNAATRQWIFGGSVNTQLAPFTNLRLSAQTNFLLEDYHRNRNLLDFQLAQQVGKNKNHEVSVSANYVLLQRTQADRDFAVQANYTWNFGVRTRGQAATQGVFGQIINHGVKSVEGLVLNINGQSAVTGPDGRFSFKNIPPGTYYLLLDPSSINLHDIPDTPLPLEVRVEPGVDATVSFGMVRSVTLSGNVEIEPQKKPTRLNGKDDRPRLFMFEISNGKETFRRVSNEHYRFEFPDIRPGTWQVRILNPASYDGFYFDRTEWELELAPGTEKALEINLLRKKKEIKFQDKLSLTSAGD